MIKSSQLSKALFPISTTPPAIKATIAGVAPRKKFCTTSRCLYWRKKEATNRIIKKEGREAPRTETSVPAIPPCFPSYKASSIYSNRSW